MPSALEWPSEPPIRSEFRMLLWVKALHVISVIAWMAGMLYLPRLFVYHAQAAKGSEASETFKIMERRLLKAIVNPSMLFVFATGFTLVYLTEDWRDGWWQAKFILVLGPRRAARLFRALRSHFCRGRQSEASPFLSDLERSPNNTHDSDRGVGGCEAILTLLEKRTAKRCKMTVEKLREHDYEAASALINAGSY